jgi:hypothetical protein
MEARVPAKWASKDGTLYIYGFKSTPPTSYKWSMKSGKLVLDSGGRIKLIYSRESTEAKK